MQPGAVRDFISSREREALKTFYGFSVVWHEQQHAFLAEDEGEATGAAQITVAASLAHVDCVIVSAERRRRGAGRALLQAAADTANYYNCHKMTAMVPHLSGAQTFFERCGYKVEAVLAQHTFKADIAVLRKFLL
ncbi:MAG: GNAT family N-acetyltransferase [Candidatus Baltobacteraceae bacterium]